MSDRLTPGESLYADLALAGIDEDALMSAMRAAPRQSASGVLTVTCCGEDGLSEEIEITFLQSTPNLRSVLGLWLGTQAVGMTTPSFHSRAGDLSRFVVFLGEISRLDIRPRDVNDALLNDYRDWLDDREQPAPSTERKQRQAVHRAEGGKLKVDTKRRYMSAILQAMRQLQADPVWGFEIARGVDLIRAADWSGVANDRRPQKILTRPKLKMLVRICRAEVIETTRRLEAAWAITDADGRPATDGSEQAEIMLELRRLDEIFAGRPPKQQSLSSSLGHVEPKPLPRLRGMDSGSYRALLASIYPSGRLLMPFLLLFAIYYRYNRSVVTGMRSSDFSEQPSVQGGTRLRGKPFKNRAGRTQYASWPIEKTADNPVEMIRTLERWTRRVRAHADPSQINHMFLERAAGATVRSLAEAYAFDKAFIAFVDDHEERLGRFNFRAIRASVINLVHHLFDGDLLATVEAGQHGVDVMVDHYLFDGARKANEEALVPGLHAREAWRLTEGRTDARSDRSPGMLAAATPGFTCLDRYAGPMSLETDDPATAATWPSSVRAERLCTEYGMCPNCRFGRTDVSSPESYALIFKLHEAILRSRTRMPAESWLGRWAAIADRVRLVTLRRFPPDVRSRADLDIPDLPTVE